VGCFLSLELLLIKPATNSASIAASLSKASAPVNLAQLAAWNPNIIGACDHLALGQYICARWVQYIAMLDDLDANMRSTIVLLEVLG
jgi:hypothetical protein